MVVNKRENLMNLTDKFFMSERKALEYYQFRWEDEYLYEDPEEYKDAIIKKAEKFNLNIKSVKLSPKGNFIKITIQYDGYTGHIDMLKEKTKIYVRECPSV